MHLILKRVRKYRGIIKTSQPPLVDARRSKSFNYGMFMLFVWE